LGGSINSVPSAIEKAKKQLSSEIELSNRAKENKEEVTVASRRLKEE